MIQKPHVAFYIPHNILKDELINEIISGSVAEVEADLQHSFGEVFSNTKLRQLIEEEVRHDHYEIKAGKSDTLTYSSSGEQRIALLNYIIDKNPSYIVVDNVFDSLDKYYQQSILSKLQHLSTNALVIQLLTRKNELLPFIDKVVHVNEHNERKVYSGESFKHLQTKLSQPFTGAIPPPLYANVPVSNPLVKMQNVSVEFDSKPVLKNITWEINGGEFWQLMGPNGSGKSTLLSLITGNSPKGYGQNLFLFGLKKGSGETVWDIKKHLGFFTPSMTMQFERQDSIEQMIISGLYDSVGLYIIPTEGQVQLAREWLNLLGLKKEKNQPFRLLPEGTQRMILIARAMIKHPPLLILDEPTAGLDDDMVFLFTALINKIAVESDTAILYVSHKTEPGLTPKKIFELIPSPDGSTGIAI